MTAPRYNADSYPYFKHAADYEKHRKSLKVAKHCGLTIKEQANSEQAYKALRKLSESLN